MDLVLNNVIRKTEFSAAFISVKSITGCDREIFQIDRYFNSAGLQVYSEVVARFKVYCTHKNCFP